MIIEKYYILIRYWNNLNSYGDVIINNMYCKNLHMIS